MSFSTFRHTPVSELVPGTCEIPRSARIPPERNLQLFYLLGRSSYSGDHGGGVDYLQAARFIHAAFNDGLSSTAYFLGKLHYNGKGVHQCFETAFD